MKNGLRLKLLFGAIFFKKLRLFLSILGIIIGVAALVVMVSVGKGAKIKVLKEFRTFGSDTVVVMAGKARIRAGRPVQLEISTTLKMEDAKALKRVFGVVRVAPVFDGTTVVEYETESAFTSVVGTTPDFFRIRRFSLSEGRIFTKKEAFHNAKVAVIGQKVKENLFGNEDPLGKRIRISKIPFEVIGVLDKIGVDASGKDQDDQVIIPITSATNRLFNVDYIKSIFVQVADEGLLDSVVKALDKILSQRHLIKGREKDYTILKAEEILKYKKKTASIFSMLIASISVISLLVGAFGVMAVMILSVKERTKEIGLRKALGATKKAVVIQFMLEAIFITFFGGLLGLFSGYILVIVFSIIFSYPLVLPVKSAFVAFVITVLFGIFSGVYPAKKAADIDPIYSLRD